MGNAGRIDIHLEFKKLKTMLYSKDEIIAAVRQELADANKQLGIADGFTDEDYKYLGLIAAAWERLPARKLNDGNPIVSGAVADAVGRNCPFCGEPCPECSHKATEG